MSQEEIRRKANQLADRLNEVAKLRDAVLSEVAALWETCKHSLAEDCGCFSVCLECGWNSPGAIDTLYHVPRADCKQAVVGSCATAEVPTAVSET